MSRWIKRLFWLVCALFGLLAVAIGGLFLVDPKVYTEYVKQHAIAAAKQRGVVLSWGKSALKMGTYTIFDVRILPRNSLIEIFAQRVSVTPVLPSVSRGQLDADISADLYGGKADSRVIFDPSEGALPRSLALRGLQVASLPQAGLLGIRSGTFELLIPSITGEKSGTLAFSGTLKLQGLSKPGETRLPAFLIGIPLTIPAIEILSLEVPFEVSPTRITLPDVALSGSLGTGAGRVVFQRDEHGALTSVSADLRFDLSGEGSRVLGPYLTLASQGTLPANERRFALAVNGPLRRPQVRLLPRAGW